MCRSIPFFLTNFMALKDDCLSVKKSVAPYCLAAIKPLFYNYLDELIIL